MVTPNIEFGFIIGDDSSESIALSTNQLDSFPSGLIALDGNDTITGSSSSEILIGNQGRDEIFGGLGNDLLFGGKDNDLVFGGQGNDILLGDIGADTLTGGEGSDVFILRRNGLGVDLITDFQSSADLLQLPAGITANNVQISDRENQAVLTIEGEEIAVLDNTSSSAINNNDFISTIQPPSNTILLGTLSGQVGAFNSSDGSYTEIALQDLRFTDIAISNNGQIFTITSDDLYRIEPITGTALRIGSFNAGVEMNALDFTGEDQLYGAAVDSASIYRINSETGEALPISDIVDPNFRSSGDLAFDPVKNLLYATARGTTGDILYTFEIDGTPTVVGDIGFSNIFGLSYENGNLLGFSNENKQILINQETGSGSFVRDIPGVIGQIGGAS